MCLQKHIYLEPCRPCLWAFLDYVVVLIESMCGYDHTRGNLIKIGL
jgi:hypothetical protein